MNYQNYFISSKLFESNFKKIVKKGIDVHILQDLLDSEVFSHSLEYEEWPSVHRCPQECIRPYNGNLFMMRKDYQTVFPEEQFSIENTGKAAASKKLHKLVYQVNFLPTVGTYVEENVDLYTNLRTVEVKNNKINLMKMLCKNGSLEFFNSLNLRDLIFFKWNTIGFAVHFVGSLVHIMYLNILGQYVVHVYVDQEGKARPDPAEEAASFSSSASILMKDP